MTDDTVLEEHMESPDLVQMRILGEGGLYCTHLLETYFFKRSCLVVQSILRGESVSTAPRRSRASAYRDRLPAPKVNWDSELTILEIDSKITLN